MKENQFEFSTDTELERPIELSLRYYYSGFKYQFIIIN